MSLECMCIFLSPLLIQLTARSFWNIWQYRIGLKHVIVRCSYDLFASNLQVQQGTPASGRPPHRLHMARGPSSPPGAIPPPKAPPLEDRHRPSSHIPSPHMLPLPPSSLPPPPKQPNFLPPPPAVLPSSRLPHIPGPAPPKGPPPVKGPSPPAGPPPGLSATAPGQKQSAVGSHAATPSYPSPLDPAVAHAAADIGNAATGLHEVNQVHPPLPSDPPKGDKAGVDVHEDLRMQIASPASGFSSPNPPPLPFSPPPVSPAVPPQPVDSDPQPLDNPPLPLPSAPGMLFS